MSTHRNERPVPLPDSPSSSPVLSPLGPPIPLPDKDARTHALAVLARWFSALEYRRTMAASAPTEAFYVPPERVFIDQPDNVEGLQFPAICILPGRGQYQTRGIGGASPDEEVVTVDGLSVLVPYDYTELITVEVWGSKIAERRAMVAALEVASGSYEGTTDLRLVMADYFGLVCTFSLMERENLEDVETPRGRRRAHLYFQMTVPVAVAARYATLDAQPGGTVKIDLAGGGATGGPWGEVLGQADIQAALQALPYGVDAVLRAMGLTEHLARQVARATLGLTPAQADALTVPYLVELCLVLAAKNAELERYPGKPPYSPADTWRDRVLRMLPRLSLP